MAKAKQKRRSAPVDDRAQLLELGGKVIYQWRKARVAPWPKAAAETRAAYRARMQELLNGLAAAGYEVER